MTVQDSYIFHMNIFMYCDGIDFAEVIENTVTLVSALQGNIPLQREFISVLSKPNSNLLKLSSEVL